jgi:hypothetical protein
MDGGYIVDERMLPGEGDVDANPSLNEDVTMMVEAGQSSLQLLNGVRIERVSAG